MADFPTLSRNLTQISQEVAQKLPLWLTGRPTSESEAKQREAELTRLTDRLRLLIRDLQSHEHLLRAQAQSIPRAPRDQQQSGQWALKQQLSHLQQMLSDAVALAQFVLDAMNRSGLNPLQMGEKGHSFFENIGHSFSHSEINEALKAGQNLRSTGASGMHTAYTSEIRTAQTSGLHPAHTNVLGSAATAAPVLIFVWVLLQRAIVGKESKK